MKKDLEYYKNNAEEDYAQTPISVLRYIGELEETAKQGQTLPLDSVSVSLLQRAVEALDDYLNAGSKDARSNASDKAKQIYQEYYNKEYQNRNER